MISVEDTNENTDKDYTLNIKKVIEKKMLYSERPPVVVETYTKEGKQRSPCTQYFQLSMGIYEELNSNNLVTELKKRFDIDIEVKPKKSSS